jgi:hypothetical protein
VFKLFRLALIALPIIAIHYAQAQDVDESLQLVTGTANPNGTPQHPTNRFTIEHLGPGHYRITFAPNVFGTTLPVCIVMPLGATTVAGMIGGISYCDFVVINTTDFPPGTFIGAPADTVFGFMAAPLTP